MSNLKRRFELTITSVGEGYLEDNISSKNWYLKTPAGMPSGSGIIPQTFDSQIMDQTAVEGDKMNLISDVNSHRLL